jgi:uncharacterized membrane protein
MSDRVGEEVTEMLTTTRLRIRHLLVAGLVVGVLAAVIPAMSLAANVGGGPLPLP